MITKWIHLKAKQGKKEQLLHLVKSLIEPSRSEVGCTKYDAYSETSDSSVIHIIEEWETAESLESHKNTPHFLNFKKLGPELIDEKGSIELDSL